MIRTSGLLHPATVQREVDLIGAVTAPFTPGIGGWAIGAGPWTSRP